MITAVFFLFKNDELPTVILPNFAVLLRKAKHSNSKEKRRHKNRKIEL